jgi:hypothetical protein
MNLSPKLPAAAVVAVVILTSKRTSDHNLRERWRTGMKKKVRNRKRKES